jgi:hypothetical protein
MNELIQFERIEEKIISIQGQQVILDSDVAVLYGVETKRVNEAVKNNPEKFPEGYVLSVESADRQELVEIFDRFQNLKHSTNTKAFTEKGLYMLATILKSPQAAQTTIAIVETFAKIRELSRNIEVLSTIPDEPQQRTLLQRSGEIMADILDGNDLKTTDTETSMELNLKLKHTVRRKSP